MIRDLIRLRTEENAINRLGTKTKNKERESRQSEEGLHRYHEKVCNSGADDRQTDQREREAQAQ